MPNLSLNTFTDSNDSSALTSNAAKTDWGNLNGEAVDTTTTFSLFLVSFA